MRESPQALAAFVTYRDLGPERSLDAVARQLAKSSQLLKRWSAAHGWVERAAEHDAQQDALRRRAADDATAQQAAQNARRILQMGESCLMLAATAIRAHVNPDGTLRGDVPVRDIPALVKAGVDCLQLASGQATERLEIWDRRQWDEALRNADADTRLTLIKGLRAARTLRRPSGTDG